MINEDFLQIIFKGLKQYSLYGETSCEKLKPIHGFFNKNIRELLRLEYVEAKGYGVDNGKEEKAVLSDGATKAIDCYFAIKNRFGEQLPGGGIIEVKFPQSSIGKNENHIIENIKSICGDFRPEGWIVGSIIIMPSRIPNFYEDKSSSEHQHKISSWSTTDCFVDKINGYMNSKCSKENRCDVMLFVCFDLDIDYDNIKTKEDYIKTIENYEGNIKYSVINGKSIRSDRLIINNPERFVRIFANKLNEKSNTCHTRSNDEIWNNLSDEEKTNLLTENGLKSKRNTDFDKIF